MAGIRLLGASDAIPHPTLWHVTTTGQTESLTRDQVPIVHMSIALTNKLVSWPVVGRT
jgi:hypothetical protein